MRELIRSGRVFLAAAILAAAGLLAGCGGNAAPAASAAQTGAPAAAVRTEAAETGKQDTKAAETGQPASSAEKVRVVATIFPEYDWLRNVIGENADHVELRLLLDKGVDMHSFQPTADDIMMISACDVFVFVGGESDTWTADALKNSMNPDQISVNLMEALGSQVKEEELVEGMQEADHDHEHAHEGGDHDHEGGDHGHEEAPGYDEHVWLSLKNAEVLTERLAEAMAEADPACAESYRANAEQYLEKLAALDAEYTEAVAAAPKKTVLFGDRFPFRYLTDDYGLDYYAAFSGCSAETEASFETIIFLAEKVDSLGLGAVLTIENSDQKIAKTIVSGTKTKDQKILSMDSMQSVTAADAGSGPDYLERMRGNLEVLKEALQ